MRRRFRRLPALSYISLRTRPCSRRTSWRCLCWRSGGAAGSHPHGRGRGRAPEQSRPGRSRSTCAAPWSRSCHFIPEEAPDVLIKASAWISFRPRRSGPKGLGRAEPKKAAQSRRGRAAPAIANAGLRPARGWPVPLAALKFLALCTDTGNASHAEKSERPNPPRRRRLQNALRRQVREELPEVARSAHQAATGKGGGSAGLTPSPNSSPRIDPHIRRPATLM